MLSSVSTTKAEVDPTVQPELLRIDQVAILLQVAVGTAYGLVKKGDLRAVRIGRSVRVRRIDLDTFIASLPGEVQAR